MEIDACPICGSLEFIKEGELNGRVYFRCICSAEWNYPKEVIIELKDKQKKL